MNQIAEVIIDDTQQTTLPDPSMFAPKGIPIELIIDYRRKGLSTREIGKLVGCSHVNVIDRLNALSEDVATIEQFKTHRADILAFTQKRLLNYLTDEKLQKAPAGTLVLAACQLYDKERLERGESTHNIASLHTDLAEMKALKRGNSGGNNE